MGSSRESSSSVLLEKQRAKQWADHHGISSTSPLRLSKASVEVPSDNTSSNSSSVLLEKQRAKQWASDHLGGSSSTKAFKAAQPQDLFAMIGREPELDEIFKGSVKLRLLSHTQNNSLRIISYRNSVLSYITPAYRIISHHNYIRIDRSIRVLLKLVRILKSAGHKILVFSQSKLMQVTLRSQAGIRSGRAERNIYI